MIRNDTGRAAGTRLRNLVDRFMVYALKQVGGGGASGPDPSSTDLPLLHRLAIVYLTLPVLIWLVGWFEWWFGIPVAALLVFAFRPALAGSWRTRPTTATIALLLVALGWTLVTHVWGFLEPGHSDWRTHRATFLDLGRGEWPTFLTSYAHAEAHLLRYYLGWWMVPGLAGKWFGPAVLNWAVPLWTWGGVALVVLLFTRGLRKLKAALLATAILVFFGGMDALEFIGHDGLRDGFGAMQDRFGRSSLAWRYEWGRLRMEYPSLMETLAWSPQHFIPAGIVTQLLIQLGHHSRFLAVSGVVLAVSLFWSPFVSVGLLVLALVLLVRNGIRPFLGWRNLLAAPGLAGLLGLYFTSGAADFQRGWAWQRYDTWQQLAVTMSLAWLTEFVVLALLLWRVRPGIAREPLFAASVVFLLLLPWVYYGSSRINDFALRSMLPALFVLCHYAARAVVNYLPKTMCRAPATVNAAAEENAVGIFFSKPSRMAFVSLILVLSIGAAPACYQLAVLFSNAANAQVLPYERDDRSILIDNSEFEIRHRTAPSPPTLLRTLLRDHAYTGFEKGKRVVSSNKYDVYLNAKRLIYFSTSCTRDEFDRRFFLHVYPADEADLPEHRREHVFDNLDFRFNHRGWKGGGKCVMTANLPDYDIARIRTGQYVLGEGRIWEGEFRYNE